jgi:hypothetical protein
LEENEENESSNQESRNNSIKPNSRKVEHSKKNLERILRYKLIGKKFLVHKNFSHEVSLNQKSDMVNYEQNSSDMHESKVQL